MTIDDGVVREWVTLCLYVVLVVGQRKLASGGSVTVGSAGLLFELVWIQ